ncbi:MAG: SIS domain-containing protein [Acidimicrobiales bacterium]
MDTLGIWEATAGVPEQLGAAVAAAESVEGLTVGGPISQVVVAGMGTSGIVGDLVAAVCGPVMAVPVAVVKSYELPAYVGPDSLLLAVSCSGDTQETVHAAKLAYDAGATVIAVTGGGELAALAAVHKSVTFSVPETLPQSRAALGALAAPALVALETLGLFDGAAGCLRSAVDLLSRRRDELFAAGGPAVAVATRIGRTLPLIYGSTGPAAVAALRWKTQVNQNAKSPAFWASLPELCHDEVAGWGQAGDVTRQVFSVVTLRHDGEHPHVAERFSAVEEMLREVVADVIEVRTSGDDDVARFFDLAFFGDVVSLLLAAPEGVDPGPVPVLSQVEADGGTD